MASFIGDSNLLEGRAGADGTVDVAGFGPVAVQGSGFAAGARTLLLLRPEAIEAKPSTAVSPTTNRLLLTDVVNYGDSLLLIGKAGSQPLRVRVPSRAAAGFEPGQTCGISWQAANVQVVGQP